MIWVRGIKPISLHSAKKLLPKFRDGKSGSFKNLEPNHGKRDYVRLIQVHYKMIAQKEAESNSKFYQHTFFKRTFPFLERIKI